MTGLEELDERIVAEALADCRARYADYVLAARLLDLCSDAVEAAELTRARLRSLREAWRTS